jgi:hypothetical protein
MHSEYDFSNSVAIDMSVGSSVPLCPQLQESFGYLYNLLQTAKPPIYFFANGTAKIIGGFVTPITLTALWFGLAGVVPALMAPIVWEIFIGCEVINILNSLSTAYAIWQKNGLLNFSIIEPIAKAIMAALGGAGSVLFVLGNPYPAHLFTAAYATALLGMFTRLQPIIKKYLSKAISKGQLLMELGKLFIDEAAAGLIFAGAVGLILNNPITIRTSQAALAGSILGAIKKVGESGIAFIDYLNENYNFQYHEADLHFAWLASTV